MSALADLRTSSTPCSLIVIEPREPIAVPVLDISESRHGKCLRIRVEGEIDLASVHEFRAALFTASNRTVGALIVDLRGVTFMGVSGLACLADLVRGNMLTAVAVVANTHAALRSMEIIGTDPDLVVFSRFDDALRFVGSLGI